MTPEERVEMRKEAASLLERWKEKDARRLRAAQAKGKLYNPTRRLKKEMMRKTGMSARQWRKFRKAKNREATKGIMENA
jgi:hypothetical protein